MKKPALFLLMIFCAAPPKADTAKPYIALSFAYAQNLRHAPSCAVWVQGKDGLRHRQGGGR